MGCGWVNWSGDSRVAVGMSVYGGGSVVGALGPFLVHLLSPPMHTRALYSYVLGVELDEGEALRLLGVEVARQVHVLVFLFFFGVVLGGGVAAV